MIHVNRGEGQPHEWLTAEQFAAKYPEVVKFTQPGKWHKEGQSLRVIRWEAGIVLREMAWRLKIRPSELSDIERGYIKITAEFEAKYREAAQQGRKEG